MKKNIAEFSLIVFDFDGVFTDNKVYVNESGIESVRCDRSDGLAINFLSSWKGQNKNFDYFVLSTESNPVVSMRCQKLGLKCIQGVNNKRLFMDDFIYKNKDMYSWEKTIYLGNDLNDYSCMIKAGMAIAPIDAHKSVLEIANKVIDRKGGDGFVREAIEQLSPIADWYKNRES